MFFYVEFNSVLCKQVIRFNDERKPADYTGKSAHILLLNLLWGKRLFQFFSRCRVFFYYSFVYNWCLARVRRKNIYLYIYTRCVFFVFLLSGIFFFSFVRERICVYAIFFLFYFVLLLLLLLLCFLTLTLRDLNVFKSIAYNIFYVFYKKK